MNFIPREIKYRDVIRSRPYNTDRRDIFNDISTISDSVIGINNRLLILNDIKEASDFTISNKLDTIEELLTELDFATTVLTLYNPDYVVYPESISANTRAIHENLYGRAIVNVLESKRLYMYKDTKTGVDIIHPSTRDFISYYDSVESSGSKIDRIIETDVLNALNPLTSDVFARRYDTYENIEYADIVLTLNTINSVDIEFNNIYISPIPESNLTLDHIKYTNRDTIGAFFYYRTGNTYLNYDINNMKKTAIGFDPVSLNSCNLRLKQPYKTGSSPYKYILGLRDLALVNHTYMNVSYIGFKVKVPSVRNNIAAIHSNLDSYPDNCELRIYSNKDKFDNITSDYEYKTTESLSYGDPLDVSSYEYIYILAKLQPFSGINSSPELRNISIEWK